MRTRSTSMQLIFVLVLGASWVAQVELVAAPRRADKAEKKPAKPAEKKLIMNVAGKDYHRTHDEAWQDALQEARSEVAALLRRTQPQLHWTPPLSFVEQRLVKEESETESPPDPDVGIMRQVELRLEISNRDYQEMVQMARRDLIPWRLLTLAKCFAGLLAVLTAFTGYVRLEEWTKGYYTAWLRLGALAFMSAAGFLLLRK